MRGGTIHFIVDGATLDVFEARRGLLPSALHHVTRPTLTQATDGVNHRQTPPEHTAALACTAATAAAAAYTTTATAAAAAVLLAPASHPPAA